MRDKATGKIAQTTRESAKIFAHHFEHNVFNHIKSSAFDPTVLNKIWKLKTNKELEEIPSIKEIIGAITKMFNGKANQKLISYGKMENY